MPSELIMKFEKPHFIVKLQSDTLQVDLKEGFKKEMEDTLESRPGLRDTLGFLFQSVIPLDVKLRDITSATVDKKGRVKVAIPHRRDIIIPLTAPESRRLVDKLNELIPIEKAREEEDLEKADKEWTERQHERAEEEFEERELGTRGF
jgi:hypothetical protein